MKFKSLFLFLILLVIVIFAIGCSQTQKPSSAPQQSQQSASGSTALPAWVSGQIAQFQLTVPNGKPPYKCSLKPGSTLPQGFTLANNCILAGAPILAQGSTRSITPPFSVIITDSSNPPLSIEFPLTVTIVESAPKLIPVSGGGCTINKKCEVEVAQANGGTSPYHFQSDTFANGAPPMGMVIGVNGYLTGKPSKAGTYTFGVCVVDSIGASSCGITSVTIVEEGQEVPVVTGKEDATQGETLRYSITLSISATDKYHNSPAQDWNNDVLGESKLSLTATFPEVSLEKAQRESITYSEKQYGKGKIIYSCSAITTTSGGDKRKTQDSFETMADFSVILEHYNEVEGFFGSGEGISPSIAVDKREKMQITDCDSAIRNELFEESVLLDAFGFEGKGRFAKNYQTEGSQDQLLKTNGETAQFSGQTTVGILSTQHLIDYSGTLEFKPIK